MSRWPVIRHARWLWHRFNLNRWNAFWLSIGYLPNQSDEDHLAAIWRGDA
ncbi:MAG: hypothetical protein IT548_06955 [Alphaproteobacteria bacterium]|nr:hypothetical protein [Alphaproteobacteria bacterium]